VSIETDFTYEIVVHKESGSSVKMPISWGGYSLSPVCGTKAKHKEFRPYLEGGFPSYGICDCGIEFEYSVHTTEKDWKNYRKRWFNAELKFGNSRTLKKEDKIKQLKNIGIATS